MSVSTTRVRPRLLDLCCRAGGASAGYHAAGFDVVGVDIEPQPHYPFRFVLADALTVDLSGFDVIAASPPCQAYSRATPTARRAAHADLVGTVRDRLRAAVESPDGPWAYVIENVPGAPLHNPVTVCGDTLRLGVQRHRLFESNLPLRGTPCHHDRDGYAVPVYGTYCQRAPRKGRAPEEPDTLSTEHARAAMGIDWMPWPDLTQAVPPAYTFWLGLQIMALRPTTPEGNGPSRDGTPSTSVQVASVTGARLSDASHLVDGVPSPVGSGVRMCRCGAPLPRRPATGRWPRYCSHACRQAAYRQRQNATTAGGPR